MIKENKVTKVIVERQKFCDDCENEIQIGLACSRANCEYCGKDLCGKCIGYEANTGGDYREVLCRNCNKIRLQYEPQIKELEKQIEDLESKRLYAANSNL